jgi:hypothetical protein
LQRARELLDLALAEGLEPPLGGCGDPRDALEQVVEFRTTFGGDDLAKLARFLRLLADLGPWLAARRARVETCTALFARLPDQRALLESPDAALDAKGEVRDEASPASRGCARAWPRSSRRSITR